MNHDCDIEKNDSELNYDSDLNPVELKLLSNFCKYFDTKTSKGNYKGDGYKFEYFLRYYLDLLGFDKIRVTKKSKDEGIDLMAECNLNLNTMTLPESAEKYYIQAKFKRLSKDGNPSYLPPHEIQALRGSIENGRGILITTGRITPKYFKKAIYRGENADELKNIPIQIIDAKILIHSFEELRVSFVDWNNPNRTIDERELDSIINKNKEEMGELYGKKDTEDGKITFFEQDVLSVNIRHNDIKCKILSIPSAYIPKYTDIDSVYVSVSFFKENPEAHKVTVSRKFISSLTEVYRKYRLLDDSGNVNEDEFSKYSSIKAYWQREKKNNTYSIRIELAKKLNL